MPTVKHVILLFILITLLLGAVGVHANGDDPNDHHDEVPITEQKREAGGSNTAIIFGAVAVFIIGGLAWKFFIKKSETAD